MAGSLHWVAAAVEPYFGQAPIIVKTGPIEEAPHGFVAEITRVRVEWKEKKEGLPDTLVVKALSETKPLETFQSLAATMDKETVERMREGFVEHMKKMQAMFHFTEVDVFQLFSEPDYPPPLPMPKCYACLGRDAPNPAIVMEDIHSASIVDLVEGFNEKQIYAILDGIVNLHVRCFSSEKWKRIVFAGFGDMAEGVQKMDGEFIFQLINEEETPYMREFQKRYLKDFGWWKDAFEKHADNPLRTLVHGDMWSPQFLWRGDKLAALVDWQLCHQGNLAEDLLHVTGLCMKRAERERISERLVEYYHSEVTERLRRDGLPAPFTLDQVKAEYKAALPHAAAAAVFALSMWANSPVLKKGDGKDEKRIAEIADRVIGVVKECFVAQGW